jgi:hypothetical protein
LDHRPTLAIAFFRRQRKVARGWLVGDKRVSEKIVERLEQMALVEESFLGDNRPKKH